MGVKKQVGQGISEKALRARYPDSGVLKDIEVELDNTLRVPSRVLAFNWQTGGGIPYGHVLELYGEENVGKTLMAMDYGYSTQQLGGIVLWADAEGTFSPNWAKQNGLLLPKVELLHAKSIELISDWQADMIVHYRSKLKNNQPILLVVDSTAALETNENLSVSQLDRKAEMGNRAKAIDTLLRSRTNFYQKYGISVVYINQLRSKIGASQFEDPDVTPGGKAMKYYASLRIGLYGGKMLREDDKKRYGKVVYCRVKKTKVGIPRDNIQLEVIFRQVDTRPVGYSKYSGLTEVLTDLKVIKRTKARYYYKDKLIAHGDEKMAEKLMEDEDLRRKLIRRSKINTISNTQEKLDALKENLYPVNAKKSKREDDEE